MIKWQFYKAKTLITKYNRCVAKRQSQNTMEWRTPKERART